MDIHELTYFKKVAELQHMTRAAQELRVAQPALSRTISGLEQELGIKLFERKGKSIALNQYGTILLRHTQRILQEMAEIERDLSEAKGEATRTVTITLYAASKLLPRLVMEFKKNYPTIILHIVQQGLDTEQKEPDLSLFSSIQPCSGPNEVTLIQEEILLALPESNPLSRCSSLNLRQVAGEEFICLQKGKSLRTITDWYCKMAGFEPNVILECDSPETVRELIRAGIGISFIPSVTWSGMETEHISLLPLSFPPCRRYINLSWRSQGALSPAAILFRDFVQRYFENLTGKGVEESRENTED